MAKDPGRATAQEGEGPVVAGRIAVVIPALDEERALPAVLAAIPRPLVTEVVVADNGSTDGTADAARGAGARVVTEPRRGYGAACLAGIGALRGRPPEIVVFLDADGSDDPTEIERLVEPIRTGAADLVIGSRVLGPSRAGSLTPVQRFGSRLAAFLLGALFGLRSTDLGPFRAIGWRALERLGMRDRGYGWTVEMQARAARAGLRCVEVPVANRPRAAGRSKISGTVKGVLGAGSKILATLARVRMGG